MKFELLGLTGALALAFGVVEFLTGQLGWSLARDAIWHHVFYLYQCAQLHLFLLLPLLASGRWRALLWSVVEFAGIALLQTDLGRDWTVWGWFVDFFVAHFPGERAFRNNSLHSLFFNTPKLLFGDGSPGLRAGVLGAGLKLATLAAGVWFLQRLWQRADASGRACWRSASSWCSRCPASTSTRSATTASPECSCC